MTHELLEIANLLSRMASKNEKDVISQYVSAINKRRYNTARILADELSDHFQGVKKADELSSTLYDRTMEFYELNS